MPPSRKPPKTDASAGSDRRPLEALRERIRLLERGAAKEPPAGLSFGRPALDAVLPLGGLPLAALHEIAPVKAEWDDGPATGFCLALLLRLSAQLPGPVFWLSRAGDLYAPGLLSFGFDPARLIESRPQGEEELLWAMEEVLRSGAAAAIVAEVGGLDATTGRRLQLAAETGGVTGFLLRRWAAPEQAAAPLTAASRWRVSALPATPATGGRAAPSVRWRVALWRCRGGRPGDFAMEWDHETGDFGLVASLCDRPAAPEEQPEEGPAGLRRAG